MQAVLHFPQVGVFAPHPIGHFLGDLRIGQDQGRRAYFLFLLELCLDFLVEVFEDRIKHGVAVPGEHVQAFDHPEGVEDRPGGVGSDVGHAEKLVPLQFFLHVGDDVEELGIRSEQFLKEAVFKAKDRADVLFGGFQPKERSKQNLEIVQDSAHVCWPFTGSYKQLW
jgi:hypothetical protein